VAAIWDFGVSGPDAGKGAKLVIPAPGMKKPADLDEKTYVVVQNGTNLVIIGVRALQPELLRPRDHQQASFERLAPVQAWTGLRASKSCAAYLNLARRSERTMMQSISTKSGKHPALFGTRALISKPSS
jgi:hypothetical protein